jgi:AmmeMemoRadiSam system protein A
MSLSAQERATLVALARSAVESAVCGASRPDSHDLAGALGQMRGCFVTLTNSDDLRGCIGTFQPRLPLGLQIIEMGRAAARDPRFVTNPISPAELAELAVEVSVLSPLEETAAPHTLEVGKHGIYIIAPSGAGCFLPEVAADMGWSAEEFLSYCCRHKAGLPGDAWKKPGTKVYLFTSEKFDH